MTTISDWKQRIIRAINLKYPKSPKGAQLWRVKSIAQQVRDVKKAIRVQLGEIESKHHAHQDPNHRIAAVLPDLFYLSGMRKSNLEKDLEEVTKWFEQTVFIFHGTEGYPEENWFPWLKKKIEKRKIKIFVPQFPTPSVVPAKIAEWFKVFKKYKSHVNKYTILVGHSLGGIFALRVLEKLEHPIDTVILVGTPIGVKPILNFKRDSSFSGFNFNWEKIKKNAKHFIVYHSDNDPYVGLKNGELLAKKLGTKLTFIPNAGHFNKKAGYTKFERLWRRLEPFLAK